MQETLPITIGADGQFSTSLKPLLNKLEMWINYQALKANWYGNEACSLCFDFTLTRTLQSKSQQLSDENWVISTGYAYHYDSSTLKTIALIAIDDLVKNGEGIERAIKARLHAVANTIALQHGLVALA